MYQHNRVVGAFILVNDVQTNQALAVAKELIGDADWKKGFSEEKAQICRKSLAEVKAPYRFKLEGTLLGVSCKETKDSSGNTYRKIRVDLGKDGVTTIISLDIGTELAERLIPKLGAAVMQKGLGCQVSISAFPDKVERDGRKFVNFVGSIKDADGVEVKASKPHFKLASEAAVVAVEALKSAGINDQKLLVSARKSAKEIYFWDIAQKIATLCQQSCAA